MKRVPLRIGEMNLAVLEKAQREKPTKQNEKRERITSELRVNMIQYFLALYYFARDHLFIGAPKYIPINLSLDHTNFSIQQLFPAAESILTQRVEQSNSSNKNTSNLHRLTSESIVDKSTSLTYQKDTINKGLNYLDSSDQEIRATEKCSNLHIEKQNSLHSKAFTGKIDRIPSPILPSYGRSQRPDDFGISFYNYPHQPMMTPNNYNPYFNWANNRMRTLDPMSIMPSMNINDMDTSSPNSFLNDPTANLPPTSVRPEQMHGWTSILPNFLNPNQQQQQNQQPSDSLNRHIKNILIPRVSGTEGNIKVRNYIIESMKANNYVVQLDEFTESTPIGDVKFANIIADSNPDACRQLVIACHYDSKMEPAGFLGAIDSAVPCSMMLKMSETFKQSFRSDQANDSLGLRFIFFDGEEAFENWTDEDSLYGSRHLAAKWEQTQAPSHCGSKNELKRIEIFLILDLIGTSDTRFVMYNRELRHHYNNLMKYERSYLEQNGTGLTSLRGSNAFRNQYMNINLIQDDHTPFLKRGVPILSLLAHPFPSVWHKLSDNYDAIDFPRTRRILHVIEEFIRNYKRI